MHCHLNVFFPLGWNFSAKKIIRIAILAAGFITLLLVTTELVMWNQVQNAAKKFVVIKPAVCSQIKKAQSALLLRRPGFLDSDKIKQIVGELMEAEKKSSEEALTADPSFGTVFQKVVKTQNKIYKAAICEKHSLSSEQLTSIYLKAMEIGSHS